MATTHNILPRQGRAMPGTPIMPQSPAKPVLPPNPRVQIIADELKAHPADYADLSVQDIADKLNLVGSAPNSEPRRTLPKRYQAIDFLLAVKGSEMDAIYNVGGGTLKIDIEAIVKSGDQRAIQAMFARLSEVYLSAESQQIIAAMLAATEPDPAWKAILPTKSRAQEIGLMGKVQAVEVAQAQALVAKA